MTIALVLEILETLRAVDELMSEHPDLAKTLLGATVSMLVPFRERMPSVEQLTAIESGMAATRAAAVQSALQRMKTPAI